MAGPFFRGEVEIGFPLANAGTNLPAWLATVAGNLFEIGELTGVRLLHLDVPEALVEGNPGPQFGIEGTRALAGVSEGPLIGTIIKPCVGFSPYNYAERVDALAAGGIDFIKDDELMADPPHCPFNERVEAVMAVVNRHAARGRKIMYAFNVSDEVDQMRQSPIWCFRGAAPA